jgi:hypothetical protein
MEAIAIRELQAAPPYRRNQALVTASAFGTCRVDTLYADNGDGVLDANEAEALLRLADFGVGSCTARFWRALLWLVVHGTVLRVAAWLALALGNRQKKI